MMLKYALNFQLYRSHDVEMATVFRVFLDHPSYTCAFKVIPVVPTVFTNGNICNAISTNGTIGKTV